MKIAWLHSHFLIWSGGAKFVYEVSRRIHRQAQVDILVEKCSPEIRAMYEAEGMRVIEINSHSSTSMLYWLFFPYFLYKNILAVRKIKDQYDYFISSIFPMNFVLWRA